VLDIREQYPYKGPYRIVEEHNVQLSYSTVARILKRHRLTRERKTKTKAKKDLLMKADKKAGEHMAYFVFL